MQQRVFGQQLENVKLGNPLVIRTHERRTIGSGPQRRRCWKGTRFVPFLFAILFLVLTGISLPQIHVHCSIDTLECAGWLSVPTSVYITGNPTLFPFPSNLIDPSLHRCGSTKCPLSGLPWTSKFLLKSTFLHVSRTYTNPSPPA